MDLQMGLKTSRIVDDFTWADFQIEKDRSGPIFVSSEANKMFILTAYLQGYKRGNIQIDINEDGTRIAISGEKTVRETIMVGEQVYKKSLEIKRFRKAFTIPDGVILDEISAKFNDDESVLTITMPKKAEGLHGIGIEEVQELVIARKGSGTLQIVDDKTSRGERSRKDQEENPEERKRDLNQLDQIVAPRSVQSSYDQHDTRQDFDTSDMKKQDIQELIESGCDNGDLSCRKQMDKNKEVGEESGSVEHGDEETREGEIVKREEAEVPERRCLIYAPFVVGSAILVTLVVFAFHTIRKKKQLEKKRN